MPIVASLLILFQQQLTIMEIIIPTVASLLILFQLQLTIMEILGHLLLLICLTILGLLTLEAGAGAVAEVIHQVLLIFLCLTVTGKCINDRC